MYEVERLPQNIDIGYTGEQDFRTIEIDMSAWVAKVPDGQPTLMHIRPGEYEPYPVETTFEDNILTWSVSDEDLGTKEGTGLLQVWFGVEDEEQVLRQLGMSAVVATIVHLSLAGEGNNSSTVQIPWLKEVMEMKNIILGYDYEAESWAVGKRGGTDVPSTDPAYHNNAKYYSEQASAAKTAAEAAQEAAETAAERDVEAWLEENFTNPDSPPLDRTLALNTAAAPADMVGDLKSAFNGMVDAFSERTNVDLSPTGYSVIISGSTGKWASNSNYKSLIQSIPTGAKYIEITANSSNNAVFAFLKTDGHSSGDTPDYATDSVRTTLEAGTMGRFAIPDDANYIYIQKSYSSTTYTPSSAVYLRYEKIPNVDDTLTISGDAADAKAVGDKFGEIDGILYETVDADLTGSYSVFINTSSKWSTSYSPTSWIITIPETAKTLTVTANNDYNSIIAFLKSTAHASQTTPDFATGTGRTVITPTNTETFNVPSDAVYLYVQKEADSKTNTPASTKWLKEKDIEAATVPLGLHEKPANNNILNIIKRCRQMTDIKWTPAVDLNRLMIVQRGGTVIPDTAETQYYLGTFKAGVEYTGIPYGRVNQSMDQYGYSYGTAGHYVGFDSFISSVSNPKSRISNVNYGSASGHRSVVYATVCSGMVCYALDVDEVATANIGNIPGLSLIGKLNNSGTLLSDSSIKIGDLLNKYDFHTGIITDIIRDDAGVIQFVEVSEATVKGCSDKNYKDGQMGGLCIRRGWTREQLFDPYTWGDYNVYRYNGTVPYIPSPYVNVGDEFDSFRIEHFPIMPYEGEGFAFKTGYIPDNAVKLVITLDGYEYVKVFKDGTEISGSPFAVTTTGSEIDPISVTEIGNGNYTAYLCNISSGDVTNLTYACHWTIGS